MTILDKVNMFLKKYEMDYQGIDMKESCEKFVDEMKKGLNAEESSLLMIPTYISTGRNIPVNEPVIVIDAGGTNLRVATVCFDIDKKAVIDDFRNYPMPGTKGELTKDEFFDAMAECVEPVMNKSGKIGFCFSFPVEILPNKDGRLIQFNKEVKVQNAQGELIGDNLLKALNKRGCRGKKEVVVTNDTVATLLGGQATFPHRKFDSYIGFILGTGTNTCYIENTSNIGKLPKLKELGGNMIINIEAGNFNKFRRSIIDIEFDKGTVNPGNHPFEKAISGAYQGGIVLAAVKKAAEEGQLSNESVVGLDKISQLSSREVDDFLFYPYGGNALADSLTGDDDRQFVYMLIDGIMERAAKLAAINITSVIIKSGKGRNICAPVCVTADGSTFYKSKLFRVKLDHYMKTFANETVGVYHEFVKADNCVLVGTAIAGLIG